MGKKLWVAIVVVAISVAALGTSIAGYQRVPKETVEIVKPEVPEESAGLKGPVYTGTSNGFIITFENEVKLYFSGDTALFGDMKFVIGDYYKPDIAFLSAGDTFTMDPVDAAFATTWINPKYAIPYHYHTLAMIVRDASKFVDEVNRHRQNGDTRAEPIILDYGVERTLDGLKVTWLGHGTFLFESPTGTRILLDPWLTANPDTPAEYKVFENFKKIDLILITHGHLDHWDLEDLEELVRLYNPPILSQYEMALYLQQLGITAPIALMNKGGKITKNLLEQQAITANMPAGMQIMLVYADHSSSPP
jgi:L-ascorbate metabolism protein UlaG (beta-lactamase superfamily)